MKDQSHHEFTKNRLTWWWDWFLWRKIENQHVASRMQTKWLVKCLICWRRQLKNGRKSQKNFFCFLMIAIRESLCCSCFLSSRKRMNRARKKWFVIRHFSFSVQENFSFLSPHYNFSIKHRAPLLNLVFKPSWTFCWIAIKFKWLMLGIFIKREKISEEEYEAWWRMWLQPKSITPDDVVENVISDQKHIRL